MKKIRNKKGSHVGVVLSFVIFITFLVFLYSVIEPEIRVQKDKESLLDYLKIELAEKIITNLTSGTITVEKTIPQHCIELQNLITELNIAPNIISKGEEGDVFPNIIEGNNLKIDRGTETEEFFFKIYSSEQLEEKTDGEFDNCKSLQYDDDKKEYTIGSVRTEEYIFEKKVTALIKEYESEGGYEDLKNELKIPTGTEFGFSFTYNNGTIIETEEMGIPTNVQVREIPVQYVDEEANILLGYVHIKVW